MDSSTARKQRILSRLRANVTDRKHKQFGSSTHQYRLSPPISAGEVRRIEERYGFRLPEDYFWFITEVGNGGAGPNYGLYPFGSRDQTNDFERLGLPNVLEPKETAEAYDAFIARYDECDDDEEYERLQAELWQGLLTIGTAGCTYDMMLVVTGKDRGRILHVDRDLQRPYYSPDDSFLDWYERWLTETAAGYEMRGFNSRIGGDEYQLTGRYPHANEREKDEIVDAMYKFVAVRAGVIGNMLRFYETETDTERKGCWLRHLERLGYEGADGLIRSALSDKSLCEAAIGSLWSRFRLEGNEKSNWSARWKPELDQWYEEILAAVPLAAEVSPDEGGVFHTCVDLLTGSGRFQAEDLEPYLLLENEKQAAWLYYKLSDKRMPHPMAVRFIQWLQENCRKRNDHEIGSALGECLSVRKHNAAEAAYLEGEMVTICMGLLRDFGRHPPGKDNPSLRENVYQALAALGKDRKWVDKNR